MAALEDIELDRLVADLVSVHILVAEGAFEDIEPVDARDFHHMAVMLILEGHALHGEVLGVCDLDHRVRCAAAVKNTALDEDIGMGIVPCRTRILAIVIARAKHICSRLGVAVKGYPSERKNCIAVYVKRPCEVVAARLYRDAVDIVLACAAARGIKRRLNGAVGAVVADLRGADKKLGRLI